MEGKHQKTNVIALLVFLAFAQLMMGGKVLGCAGIGEGCGAFNWCCPGADCSNTILGGVCEYDSFSGCKNLGESCGFFDASCCGKRVCTATLSGGTCEEP